MNPAMTSLARWTAPALLLAALHAGPAWADDTPAAPPPDKSGYWLFNPPPDTALRGFSSDRPTKGNSPVTVDAGHVQYETDLFNYTHSNVGGVSTRLYTAFDPVLKVGLTNRVDLELQFTGYNWAQVNQPGSNTPLGRARGAGDLLLRTKVNVFGNEDGPGLAIIPYVKFPTAARGIGNGHTEGGLIVPITTPLPLGFTLEIEPEVDVLTNAANAGHHFNYTQLITLSHAVGPLTAYLELYSALGTDHRTPPVYTLDTALSYPVTSTFQLDIGANFGLNRNAPNLQLYTGAAQRF